MKINNFPVFSEQDVQALRNFLDKLSSYISLVDFEENMQLESVRSTVRIWRQGPEVIAFAYVDDFNNLWFECLPDFHLLEQLETEIIEWGKTCIRKRNIETGQSDTLDFSCSADDSHRLQLLEKHGFAREAARSLHYSLNLRQPAQLYPLPEGFSIRPVKGEEEINKLVALHRAAFGTDQMTVEYRLAMMSTPQYLPEVDLVAENPCGELVAFCVCGFEDIHTGIGYTDPIGVHPNHQRKGLGSAIVSAGIRKLRELGATRVELGTSSENIAMQKLAEKLGFELVSEKLWFSKEIKS